MTQIEHFTESNSKLISDYIYSIDINNATGEVFFGTYKGLCSYMSDVTATVEEMNNDVTYAYPNPVRPEYTGPITITGLTYNADIKIVTVNGTLVNKGRSTGGSYIWDGNDMNGKRVASGIYMVQTATQTGEKGTVCKIAIIN
jgi:flagellar hook assembly protein FlgD